MKKKIHYIAGLPRTGSTLLCNVLCQNPRFYASGTSPLVVVLRSAINAWSNAPAVKNQMDADREGYFQRFKACAAGLIEGWYSVRDEPVVFDKCRSWSANWNLLRLLFGQCKMILCVRDLREVVANCVRHAEQTELMADGLSVLLEARVISLLGPDGVIGGPLTGLHDMILRTRLQHAFVWKYEDFCTNPVDVMSRLYKYIDEPVFDHDFENVQKAHDENDAIWNYSYPHGGVGKVQPPKSGGWKDMLPDLGASKIMQRYQWYNEAFGYRS